MPSLGRGQGSANEIAPATSGGQQPVAAASEASLLRRAVAQVAAVIVVAGTYYILAYLSQALLRAGVGAFLLYPAAGFATAALLIGGVRLWPGILAGAFFANPYYPATGGDWSLAALMATGSTLQAAAGVALVRHWFARPALVAASGRTLHVLLLVGPVACLVGATVGVASLLWFGATELGAAARQWLAWWVGASASVVLFAPVALIVWPGSEPQQLAEKLRHVAWLLVSAAILLWGAIAVDHLQQGISPAGEQWRWLGEGYGNNLYLAFALLFSLFAAFVTLAARNREYQQELAVRRLAENEARLAAIVESPPDAILAVDADLKVTHFNRAFKVNCQQTYGVTPVPGMTLDEVFGATEQRIVDSAREQVLPALSGQQTRTSVRLRNWDGTVIDTDSTCSPILDARGKVIGASIFIRDVTASKRMTEQLSSQLEELSRWRQATMGRESRILELKDEVNSLLAQAGKPPRYHSGDDTNRE